MSTNVWEGTRVRLRAVEPEDWEAFYTWNLDSDMPRHLYAIPFPQSQAAARRWAEQMAVRQSEDDTFFFVIETLAAVMVGSISTHDCRAQDGTLKYGVAVRREHQRQGYAAEAIRLVLGYYFGTLRYQKANAHVYSFNTPSIRLHEHLGFQLEGRLRRMIYAGGAFHDELVFGITAEEFAAR